jgi:hypothetical protein
LGTLQDDHTDKDLEGSERGSAKDVSVFHGPHVQEFKEKGRPY